MALWVGAGTKGDSGWGRGCGVRMVWGEGNRGAKKMSDVRRGLWVGLWGGKRAEMGWSRKKGGESGLFVAFFRGDAELLSLWTRWGGGGERNGRVRRAAGVLGGGLGVGFCGSLPACLGLGVGLRPGLLKVLSGGCTGLGFGFVFGFGFGFGLGCTADGSGSRGR